MYLISFFSRSGDEGWVHHFSEMFDSCYWVCGQSADGLSCIDLQGIEVVDTEYRKFDQERCPTCLERLVAPQLLSSFNLDPTQKSDVAKYASSSTSTSDTLDSENRKKKKSSSALDKTNFRWTYRHDVAKYASDSTSDSVGSFNPNDVFVHRRFSDRSFSRKKKSSWRRASESLSSAPISNGPEIIYQVSARVVQIEPSIKISFFHLTTKSDVAVEINDDRVSVENESGGFISEQTVTSSWLRAHLQLEQPVRLNLLFDKNVWKVLRLHGEFRLKSEKALSPKHETKSGTLWRNQNNSLPSVFFLIFIENVF